VSETVPGFSFSVGKTVLIYSGTYFHCFGEKVIFKLTISVRQSSVWNHNFPYFVALHFQYVMQPLFLSYLSPSF